MYPDTLLVSFGSEIGQWGAIYRSTIKIVIPGGKLETSRKKSKYNVQSKMERNSLFLLLWLVDITKQEEIPKGWF